MRTVELLHKLIQLQGTDSRGDVQCLLTLGDLLPPYAPDLPVKVGGTQPGVVTALHNAGHRGVSQCAVMPVGKGYVGIPPGLIQGQRPAAVQQTPVISGDRGRTEPWTVLRLCKVAQRVLSRGQGIEAEGIALLYPQPHTGSACGGGDDLAGHLLRVDTAALCQ